MCYIHPQTPTEVMDREGKPILGLPSKDRSLIHSLSRYLTNKIFATPCARHLGYTALPPRRSIDWFYRNVSVWLALRMPRSHIANSKIFCFGFGEDQMRHENIWKLESSLHIWGVNIIYMTTLFRWPSDSSTELWNIAGPTIWMALTWVKFLSLVKIFSTDWPLLNYQFCTCFRLLFYFSTLWGI